MIDFHAFTPDDLAERAKSLGLDADAFSPRFLDRFAANIDHSAGPDGCWPWTSSRQGSGYGIARVDGTSRGAHRVAYVLGVRPLPDRTFLVRHDCDNPSCVNPRHLRSGTHAQNNADTIGRGRARGRVLDDWDRECLPDIVDRFMRSRGGRGRRMGRAQAFRTVADIFDVSASHAGRIYDEARRAGRSADTEPAAPPDLAP